MTSPHFVRLQNPRQISRCCKSIGVRVAGILEFFRPEQRVDQIAHNNKRHDQANQIFQSHSHLLQTITAADIEPRDYKKDYCHDDKYNVSHLLLLKIDSSAEVAFASTMPVIRL